MDINSLEGNSHKSKGEDTKVAKLETYDIAVKTKKPNKMTKIAKSVIAEDARNVGSYILLDVLIPALKKLVVDIVENGITALIYGQDAPVRRSGSTKQKVSYNDAYVSSSLNRTRASELRNRSVYDMDDILFETRGEADMLLEDLKDAVSRYRSVSIGDLRSALKLPTTNTDWNYGWTDLGSAEVVRNRDGYSIIFPRIVSLN